jgi:hypothetical protein
MQITWQDVYQWSVDTLGLYGTLGIIAGVVIVILASCCMICYCIKETLRCICCCCLWECLCGLRCCDRERRRRRRARDESRDGHKLIRLDSTDKKKRKKVVVVQEEDDTAAADSDSVDDSDIEN